MAEAESDVVRDAMDRADGWLMCRIGFVETVRAVGLSAGAAATKAVREEWPAFDVIEVDQSLAENAAQLAIGRELRGLAALHLAAALVIADDELVLATWDRRLHAAARTEALRLIPEEID